MWKWKRKEVFLGKCLKDFQEAWTAIDPDHFKRKSESLWERRVIQGWLNTSEQQCLFMGNLLNFHKETLKTNPKRNMFVLLWLKQQLIKLKCVISLPLCSFICSYSVSLPSSGFEETLQTCFIRLTQLCCFCRMPHTSSRSIFWTSVVSAFTFSGTSTINSGRCE